MECDSLFQQTITFQGACCSFNFIALKNIRIGDTVTSDINKDIKTVSASGPLTGLTVVLNPQIDDYFYPNMNFYG